jgi:hypothetical protein
MPSPLCPLLLRAAAFCACLLGLPSAAAAQTVTVQYNLDNVWMIADVSHPYSSTTYPMTGSFEWTYTVGDFENGTGTWLTMDIPWYGTDVNSLNINIDMSSIEFVLPGNWQNLGLDITLHLLEDLSPTHPSNLDLVRSAFDIENGSIHKGHFVSGQIIPEPQLTLAIVGTCPSISLDISGVVPNGQVAILYSFGTGAFTIPAGYACAGTTLGLDTSVTLGTVQAANLAGTLSWPTTIPAGACGSVYLQALDLTSCGLSDVVLLQ